MDMDDAEPAVPQP